jgi:hypothetical protein
MVFIPPAEKGNIPQYKYVYALSAVCGKGTFICCYVYYILCMEVKTENAK